ncbi:hypothetical protein AVEN_80200-1 [Araneus ventricosus]|uniref:Uncharacterized protein n=1 Tax=Araneus ventricosus TaxID=182803 RepID=A0A4Y2FFM9_ARAVE|nr:hypothetical protein AVEN_80200-1 [Araneus ventricosus]
MHLFTIGTLTAKGLANTGLKRPFSLSSDCGSQINTTELALRLFTFPLSSSPLLSFPPFLNTLPSEAIGEADELFLGDSSSSWINHPTAVVCLPPWC